MLRSKEPANYIRYAVGTSKMLVHYTLWWKLKRHLSPNISLFQGNIRKSRASIQFRTVFKKIIQEMLSQRNCDFQTKANFQREKKGYKHNLTAIFCILPHDLLLVNEVKLCSSVTLCSPSFSSCITKTILGWQNGNSYLLF